MKVALFCDEFPVASETFVIRHVVALMEAGVDLSILVGQTGTAWNNVPEAMRERVKNRTIALDPDLSPGWRRAIGALPAPGLLARQIGRLAARALGGRTPPLGRHDAILAHFGPMGVKAMSLRDQGLIAGPIATIFHGFDMSAHQIVATLLPAYRKLFRKTQALLPISHFWAARLREWGADPAKIRVLRMGTDMPDTRIDTKRPLHTPLRVLQVGRLVEKKAARYAIEAVRRANVPIAFDIIGSGPQEDELRALEASTPGTNGVTFRGLASHREVLDALTRTDVFLLPSVTAQSGDMEGVPVALMEAMLAGCIVLSTRHSGIPELVDHSVSGLLVPERDAPAIAQALEAIARGDYDLPAMREAAIARVEQEFNNARLDGELLDILVRVAEGRPLKDAGAGDS